MKTIAATAAFVAAAAFFGGGSEALLNHFWPPRGTWHPDRLLESAYGRTVFYGAIVLAGVAAAAAGGAGGRLLARRKSRRAKKAPPRRGAVVTAAVATSSAGWLLLGRLPGGKLTIGSATFDLGEVAPFFSYWFLFLVLDVVLTVLLLRFASPRRWWPVAGRYVRLAGAVGFVAVVAGRWAEATLRPVPRGPNVVVIILDAWRADAFRDDLMPDLAAYGRRRAVRYTRAWSCASWTVPSMGSIFTGEHVDSHGGRAGPARDDVSPTLAQLFRAQGYETTAFVANRLLDRHHPICDGFDNYLFWDWPPLLRATRFFHTNWYGPAVRDLVHRERGPEASRELTLLLGRYLARPHRRPFLLWVHYMDPHSPYSPPPAYCLSRDERFLKSHRAQEKSRRFAYHRLYEGECAYVNDLLARAILPRLEADDDTIAVITSDHGEEFWEHNFPEHGKSVYEPAIRVPLLISVPGEAPATVGAPVSLVDLAPTILEYAGLEIPATMQGRPLPRAEAKSASRPVFVGSMFTKPRSPEFRKDAIIVWPYKLIVKHADMRRPGEYYNLARDPGERTTLPEDETAARLRARLQNWKKAVTARKRPNTSAMGNLGATETADEADLRALGYIQ